MKEESVLMKILKQEPTTFKADTRTLHDIAEEEGLPFEVVFEKAVKKANKYELPEINLDKAVRNMTKIFDLKKIFRIIRIYWRHRKKK